MTKVKYSKMPADGYAEWRKANRPKTFKDRRKELSKNACRKGPVKGF